MSYILWMQYHPNDIASCLHSYWPIWLTHSLSSKTSKFSPEQIILHICNQTIAKQFRPKLFQWIFAQFTQHFRSPEMECIDKLAWLDNHLTRARENIRHEWIYWNCSKCLLSNVSFFQWGIEKSNKLSKYLPRIFLNMHKYTHTFS